MSRFMFAFTWTAMPDASVARSEREQVIKLIADKKMEQMFLANDRSKGWLIMIGESQEQALEQLSILPFYPIMHFEVTLLLDAYP
ncbi:MAG: hypothetical protein H7Y86_09540 [Rhizobacter sp.]|nr:hypothetical protein [Ferruginibacter sp.]